MTDKGVSSRQDLVTHFYGLFSATQGLPVSHVILGSSDAAIAQYKDTLLSLGRLAATVSSTAARSGVFRFNLASQTFVGLSLAEQVPFFILLHITDNSCNELILKCIQIGHVLTLLYTSFLTDLGSRIERDLEVAMNNASFAGNGVDEDCDTHYEDTFSVLEDHYISSLLAIPVVSALFTAPVDHAPHIQSLREDRGKGTSDERAPSFPFMFGLYMLYADAEDDFEIPLAGASHHTLLYHTDTVTRELLRFYRTILADERIKSSHSCNDNIDLKFLLDSSLIMLLDLQPANCGCGENATALIISATHKDDMFVAMRVPAAWLDRSLQTGPSSHLLLAKAPVPSPVHLSEAGVTLFPLAALTAPVVDVWTALLCRLLLYFPSSPPSRIPPPAGKEHDEMIGISSQTNSDAMGDVTVFTVDQIAALLLPAAPDPHALGSLQPHPPHSPPSTNGVDKPGDCPSRPASRPAPPMINSNTPS